MLSNLGRPGIMLPFVRVHLKAAYLAQHMDDPERADLYYQMSCIRRLKDMIVDQVKGRVNFSE